MDEYLPKLSDSGRRWVRFFGLLAAVALLVWLVMVLRQVLTPIAAAIVLAYILNPAVTWLEKKRRIKRLTSVGLGLAVVLLIGGVLLLAGVLQIVQFAGDSPAYAEKVFRWLEQTVPTLMTGGNVPATLRDAAGLDGRQQLLDLMTKHGLSVGGAVVGYIGRIVSNAFYWLSLTLLLPLYTFFFLLHFNGIVQAVREHLPAAYRPRIVHVVSTIDAAISSFFRGRLLVCLAVGTLLGIGWMIVGVPYSLALGALAGALNLVPFLSVLALPPALLLTYLNATEAGTNWVLAISLVFMVYLAVQAIESFALTPTIEAKASGLHPITTVIALLIGGQLAGLLGMLLAIPITSTLKSLSAEYVLPEVRRLAGTRPLAAEKPPDEPAGRPRQAEQALPAKSAETSDPNNEQHRDRA